MEGSKAIWQEFQSITRPIHVLVANPYPVPTAACTLPGRGSTSLDRLRKELDIGRDNPPEDPEQKRSDLNGNPMMRLLIEWMAAFREKGEVSSIYFPNTSQKCRPLDDGH